MNAKFVSLCAFCVLASVGKCETVIHTFGNFPTGAAPCTTLTRDSAGSLYGTASKGGSANLGVIFKVTVTSYQVLYNFKSQATGANPCSRLALDPSGNLYGTAAGGIHNAGVVFKLDTSGHYSVLYTFTGGADGKSPTGEVILDAAGNLYGTTTNGGTADYGTVFKLDPTGHETVIHSFTGIPDGALPQSGVVADTNGNLYGVTFAGGASGNYGMVYKLDAGGQETVLHRFDSLNGANPSGSPILDGAGILYGTTAAGGLDGVGVIYQIENGRYLILHAFTGTDGANSLSAMCRDTAGHLYGVTANGGTAGKGTVYRLHIGSLFQVLYSFPGVTSPFGMPSNGVNGGVILDSSGQLFGANSNAGLAGVIFQVDSTGAQKNLYSFPPAAGGTAPGPVVIGPSGSIYGGTGGGTFNAGVVYKVDTAGQETVLHNFAGGVDGSYPVYMTVDSAGNVYGTTYLGGVNSKGSIYTIDTAGVLTVLYSFANGTDGEKPTGVVLDPSGNLYGAAGGGATSYGLIYKLDPAGHFTVLYNFTGMADGAYPQRPLLRNAVGNLYGTTGAGGAAGYGVVFTLDASGTETVLHSFTGGTQGAYPTSSVTSDVAGSLYGTAESAHGAGLVYRCSSEGAYEVLYNFPGASGAANPSSAVPGPTGNVYGVTEFGGTGKAGTAFLLTPSGLETALYNFTGKADGGFPVAVALGTGALYGTTSSGGGPGGGVLFQLNLQ